MSCCFPPPDVREPIPVPVTVANVGVGAVPAHVSESPWIPILVGVTGLAIGFGLAYVVTRPKTAAELAHEMMREEEVRAHVRRLRNPRRRTR